MQIFSYTEAEWLDIVEIEFQPGQERGTLAKVSKESWLLLIVKLRSEKPSIIGSLNVFHY